MATERQIHWWGEAALYAVIAGVCWFLFNMVNGGKHLFDMPIWVRIAGLIVATAIVATLRTWRFYRREERRERARTARQKASA